MPFIKFGEVKIDSDRLGLPPNVQPTPDQTGEKIAEALDERDVLRVDRDNWRQQAELHLSEIKSLQNAKEKLAESECDVFLGKAVNAFKIDTAMVAGLKEMWKNGPKGPAIVRKMVDGMRANAYLAEEKGLRGSVAPTDPIAEVMALAAEMVANDAKHELTMSDAQFRVLAENPELSKRYREATVVGVRKGGDQ